jgi:hypothetical protein
MVRRAAEPQTAPPQQDQPQETIMNAKRISLILALAGAAFSTGAGAYGINDIPEKFLQSFGPGSAVTSHRTVPSGEAGMWTALAETHGVGVATARHESGDLTKRSACIHPKGPVGDASMWTTLAETHGVGLTPEQARTTMLANAPCPLGGAARM